MNLAAMTAMLLVSSRALPRASAFVTPHAKSSFAAAPRSTLFSTSTRHSSTSSASSHTANGLQDNKLLSTFNHQITNELTASQLYLSASLWCRRQNLVGMSSYMRAESDEERGHATELIDFANQRNIPLQLQALDAPPHKWKSVLHLWESLLEAEEENTKALNYLADLADEARDHAMSALLDPFHMEQVESEDALRTIVAKVSEEAETPGLLRQLDSELAPETRPQA